MNSQWNGLRATLESGDVAYGAACVSGEPCLVELLGKAGADFVWVDLEHGGGSPLDTPLVEHLGRAAEAGGTELMVRLPGPDPFAVRKAIDAGVRSLLLPRVETADEVERALEACRFTHDGEPGERGVAPTRANAWGRDFDGYPDRADGEVLCGVMIENATAVENLDAILSLPGLGFAFVGPGDLSVSLGHPLEMDHPDVREAIEEVEAAGAAHDIPLAGIVVEGQDASELADRGYQLITVGSDVMVLREAFEARFAAVSE